MSIASELARLQQAKADIKTAIEAKGVSVPSSAKLDTYDDYVAAIVTGGGGGDIPMPSSASSLTLDSLGRLTSITIKDGVTSIGGYDSCFSLTSVTLPDSVTTIEDYAFKYTRIAHMVIPSGVTSLGDSAFEGVEGLVLTCLPTTPPTFGDYTLGETQITHIYVPSESVNAYKAANGWSYYANYIYPIP